MLIGGFIAMCRSLFDTLVAASGAGFSHSRYLFRFRGVISLTLLTLSAKWLDHVL